MMPFSPPQHPFSPPANPIQAEAVQGVEATLKGSVLGHVGVAELRHDAQVLLNALAHWPSAASTEATSKAEPVAAGSVDISLYDILPDYECHPRSLRGRTERTT